jgi:hypothetical protein
MKKIRLPLALSFLLFAFNHPAAPVDWPSASSELRSSFGQNERGRPSVGMTFAGDDAVRAMDAGEIVFVANQGPFRGSPREMPHPLGEWIAVDHGGGIVATYGRLAPNDSAFLKTVVEKGSVLGHAGSSGWAEGPGFFFSVYDRTERRWANPTMIAPPRIDTRAPTVKSVALQQRDGQILPLSPARAIRQGVYRVLVEASDAELSDKSRPLTPQRLICLVNGSEQGSLHLETIKAEDGGLIVARTTPSQAALVYQSSGAFDLGEIRLSRGRTTLEILAKDASGNERVSTITFMVD